MLSAAPLGGCKYLEFELDACICAWGVASDLGTGGISAGGGAVTGREEGIMYSESSSLSWASSPVTGLKSEDGLETNQQFNDIA